jgi:hypothetical protein
MSEYLDMAAKNVTEAIKRRQEAEKLNSDQNPDSKAQAALLSRLADRNAEQAIGALRNDLGLSNER